MRTTGAATFALVAIACGGSAFTSATTPPDGGASPPDGGQDAGVRRGTYCGPGLVCAGPPAQQGTICCLSSQPACAAQVCGCGVTQLDCWRDSDCPESTPICCLGANPSCTGSALAQCVSVGACTGNRGRELCDPNDQGSCKPLFNCSGDVSCTLLPTNVGYGICGGC